MEFLCPSPNWKNCVCCLVSIYFNNPQLDIQQKRTVQNLRLLIWRNARFWFLQKGMELVSPPYFVYVFSRKTFLKLYFINCRNFNFLRYCVIYWDIAIVCFSGCGVIHFENNLIFLIKPFFYMTKTSSLKFKYLENKKSF